MKRAGRGTSKVAGSNEITTLRVSSIKSSGERESERMHNLIEDTGAKACLWPSWICNGRS